MNCFFPVDHWGQTVQLISCEVKEQFGDCVWLCYGWTRGHLYLLSKSCGKGCFFCFWFWVFAVSCFLKHKSWGQGDRCIQVCCFLRSQEQGRVQHLPLILIKEKVDWAMNANRSNWADTMGPSWKRTSPYVLQLPLICRKTLASRLPWISKSTFNQRRRKMQKERKTVNQVRY